MQFPCNTGESKYASPFAGYASNIFDSLCRQQVTAEGYRKLVEIVKGIADKYADGRLIAILEGGKGNHNQMPNFLLTFFLVSEKNL